MENSKKHLQLPNNMVKEDKLSPKDLLVYLCIKKYMNYETKECFPSLTTISKDSGYSINTIRSSIENIVKENFISIKKKGRSQIYIFNPHKNFEPFSEDFLYNEKSDSNEKAYIIAVQQHLITDQEEGFGKTTYSNAELSKLINLSPRVIANLDKSLEKKGYISIIKTSKRDSLTGLMKNEKIFHLGELGQKVIWTLRGHENRIESAEERLTKMEKQFNIVLAENAEFKRREIERDEIREDNTQDVTFFKIV